MSVKNKGKPGFPDGPVPSFGKKLRKQSMKKPNSIDRTHVAKQSGPTTTKAANHQADDKPKKGTHHQIKSYDNCIDSIEN